MIHSCIDLPQKCLNILIFFRKKTGYLSIIPMFAALVLPAAASALRPPAALTRRQCTASAVITAAVAALPHRANAQEPSLTDAVGRFVVDPRAEPGAYSTISAALSAAPKGATVVVRPGLYAERVFLKSEVSILGDKGAVLAWKSDRPYEAALTVDLSLAAAPCRVLIQGLEIRHSSPSIAQNYAVYVPAPSAAPPEWKTR